MAIIPSKAPPTPIGFIRYSLDFFESAIAVDDCLGKKDGYEIFAPVPVLFLAGQSIELALKAYLLFKGISIYDLKSQKKYGHDLHRCLRKAKELGLYQIVRLSAEEEALLELLNALYATKQLQYIVVGEKTFPIFGPLKVATEKLVFNIAKTIGYPDLQRLE